MYFSTEIRLFPIKSLLKLFHFIENPFELPQVSMSNCPHINHFKFIVSQSIWQLLVMLNMFVF